ncbi:tripartite tricarboxylate transporter substrate binding protein [Alcaligenes sp. 13f]|uniref:Bug family tripartite tricarboxylate transporter substrate binding protein n=1 Tax=Alcaligenes sp. 13f TaxID=2841924 RepID=UPI001CF675DD|nr:tripartite tricarboxylate transporter substrate binding protein [Alcaligenes sp. 13f]MCB4321977.1 tripartite tricarboxylate transporter substrate binding protein [Alcaligenes sp. 13f]
MIIKKVGVALLSTMALGIAKAETVESWPNRPVTIIVPFAAGQTGDIVARMLGKELQNKLKQSVIVENRPGAGGRIGTTYAARSKPDGYTLLMTSTGPYAITPALYPESTQYNSTADFTGIAEVGSTPQVIVVSANAGVSTFNELVAKAKTNDLSYGSAGNGSLQHLTMELLKDQVGFPMLHVPFKGSSESKTALIGNTLDASTDSLPALISSLKSNQLHAVAVISPQRSSHLPDVPTLKELGYAPLSAIAFFGLVAPKGTPEKIVDLLNNEIISIFRAPVFQDQMHAQALSLPTERTAAEFSDYLKEESTYWKTVVDQANITIE